MATGQTCPTGGTGSAGEFLAGVRLLGRGLALVLRTPRLLLLGLLPVAVTALLFAAGLVVLLYSLGDLTAAVTSFAADWSAPARTLTRLLAGLALLGAAGLLGVISFTAVTLAIGEPWYERISARVEELCGGGPPAGAEPGGWRSFWSGLADSARLIAIAAPIGLSLFLAGLLPALGQTVVPVLGALVGGWFLAVELVPGGGAGRRPVHPARAAATGPAAGAARPPTRRARVRHRGVLLLPGPGRGGAGDAGGGRRWDPARPPRPGPAWLSRRSAGVPRPEISTLGYDAGRTRAGGGRPMLGA